MDPALVTSTQSTWALAWVWREFTGIPKLFAYACKIRYSVGLCWMGMAFTKVSSPVAAMLSSVRCRCIFRVTLAAPLTTDWGVASGSLLGPTLIVWSQPLALLIHPGTPICGMV